MVNHSTRSLSVGDFPLDFSRMLAVQYQEVDNSIRHADVKAQLILGINTLLIAAVTNSNTAIRTGEALAFNLDSLFDVMVLVCLLLSIFYALSTIIPRFKSTKSVDSLFFFGDIIKMNEADYIDRYMTLSTQDIKAEVIAQIHAKSFIVKTKFMKVRFSLVFLFMGLGVWVLGAVAAVV